MQILPVFAYVSRTWQAPSPLGYADRPALVAVSLNRRYCIQNWHIDYIVIEIARDSLMLMIYMFLTDIIYLLSLIISFISYSSSNLSYFHSKQVIFISMILLIFFALFKAIHQFFIPLLTLALFKYFFKFITFSTFFRHY